MTPSTQATAVREAVPPPPDGLIPALLVGGRSRRMGRDKALLRMDGCALGARLVRLLTDCVGVSPVLSGDGPAGPGTETLLRVPDREPGAGPLSALLGLFDRFPGRDFLALAVDLPAMSAPALNWLLERAAVATRPAVWPRLPGRPFGEPLASVYRAAAAPLLENRWRAGERSLKRALGPEEREEPLPPEALQAAFVNVNTPGEWAALKRRQGVG